MGLEKGLRTNRETGLSIDETGFNRLVTFEEVVPKGIRKYSVNGNTKPVVKLEAKLYSSKPPPLEFKAGNEFIN